MRSTNPVFTRTEGFNGQHATYPGNGQVYSGYGTTPTAGFDHTPTQRMTLDSVVNRTGLTMGTVAFLLGDGRYGVFEIAKHVSPGVLVDLFHGVTRRLAGRGRLRGVIAWSLLGLIAALDALADDL